VAADKILPEGFSELCQASKCPVCLEPIRPDCVNEYGLCKNSHLVCKSCTLRLSSMTSSPMAPFKCPVCKAPEGLTLTRHNYLANLLLKFSTQLGTYSCSHCSADCLGKDLLSHEMTCSRRPIPCPITTCPMTGELCPISSFTALRHPCFRESTYMTPDKYWDIFVSLRDVQSTRYIRYPTDPMLLLRSDIPDFRLFLHPHNDRFEDGYGINVGWLDGKQFAPSYLEGVDVLCGIYMDTAEGPLCKTSRSEIRFLSAYYRRPSCLVLDEETLVVFSKQWSGNCSFCSQASREGHAHIRIELSKEICLQ